MNACNRFDMTEHYRENLPQPPLAWCGIFKKKMKTL
jgi:hypothetical protein